MLQQLGFSVSFTVSVGCKSIRTPVHHTRIYMLCALQSQLFAFMRVA